MTLALLLLGGFVALILGMFIVLAIRAPYRDEDEELYGRTRRRLP